MRSTQILLAAAIGLTALLCLGCTNEQLGRAEVYAQTTHTLLGQAQANVAALETQLAAAQKAAAESGDARIVAVVEQLQGAVRVAKTYLPALQVTAQQADNALASLKATGATDVPWWKVALGVAVPLLLPLAKGIPVVGPAIGQLGELGWSLYTTSQQKAQQAAIEARAKAMEQTVAGLDEARKSLGNTVWDQHVAPALEAAQDADVKAIVKTTQAKALASAALAQAA